MKRFSSRLIVFFSFFPLAALGDVITLIDQVDDAILTLSIENEIESGTQASAIVRIQVDDDEVSLTSGDSVLIELFEDDLLGDDLIFGTSFLVTAAEVAAGFVDRVFEVLFDPLAFLGGELGNTLEIYASAFVDKSACGFACFNDAPETGLANVSVVESTDPPPPTDPSDPPTSNPTLVSQSDTDGDAKITLSTLDQVVIGSSPPTSIRIEVDDRDVPLTLGDTVLIELFEDDFDGDDLLFSTLFDVSADEVLAGFVDRTFDLAFDPSPFFPESTFDSTLELFASAFVDKSACGFFCANDTPETALVFVDLVEADFEPPIEVSEPSSLALLALGLFGVGLSSRRKV